jgi:membrane dipeptidase
MNRVGLVVDMSHSAERSTLEAMEVSARPIAITHANPAFWHPAQAQQVRHRPARAGGDRRHAGLFALSPPPEGGSDCTLTEFCEMIARTAEVMGVERLGIGSDLCQDQPDSVVEWMRVGRWTKRMDYGEGSADAPGLPAAARLLPRQPRFPASSRGLARRRGSTRRT